MADLYFHLGDISSAYDPTFHIDNISRVVSLPPHVHSKDNRPPCVLVRDTENRLYLDFDPFLVSSALLLHELISRGRESVSIRLATLAVVSVFSGCRRMQEDDHMVSHRGKSFSRVS